VGGGKDGGLPIIGNMPLAPFTEIVHPSTEESADVDSPSQQLESGMTEGADSEI